MKTIAFSATKRQPVAAGPSSTSALCVNREMFARSCQLALWQAILGAQHAGYDDAFVAEIMAMWASADARCRAMSVPR